MTEADVSYVRERWDPDEDITPVIADMMRLFPPLCRVIARRDLRVPAAGRVGRVIQYVQWDDNHGSVVVRDEEMFLRPEDVKAVWVEDKECLPHWLLPVQYDGNKTPAWVERLLVGQQEEPEDPILEGKIAGPMTDNPTLVVVRLDNGRPLTVHPKKIGVCKDGLFVEDMVAGRVQVIYAMSLIHPPASS